MGYKDWIAHVRTDKGSNGTGLAISPRHVLTAAHVLDAGSATRCRFPWQNAAAWHLFEVAWFSPEEELDVALLELSKKQADLGAPFVEFRHWVAQDERWSTEGFPATEKDEEDRAAGRERPSWPVAGSTHDRARADQRLVLVADAEPSKADPLQRAKDWRGLSGAPVILRDGSLAGIIRTVKPPWDSTLVATPVSALLQIQAFLDAYGNARAREQRRCAEEYFHRQLEASLDAGARAELAQVQHVGLSAGHSSREFRERLLGLELLAAIEAVQTAHHRALEAGRRDVAAALHRLAHLLLPVAEETLQAVISALRSAPDQVVSVGFATPLMAEALSAALDRRSPRYVVRGPEIVGELRIERPGESGLLPANYFERVREALVAQLGPQLDRARDEAEDRFRQRQNQATNKRIAAEARRSGGSTVYFCVAQHGEMSAEPATRSLLKEAFPALRLIELGIGPDDEQELVPLFRAMLDVPS